MLLYKNICPEYTKDDIKALLDTKADLLDNKISNDILPDSPGLASLINCNITQLGIVDASLQQAVDILLQKLYDIEGRTVIPAQLGYLTFNGEEQSPTWLNYDSQRLDMGGDISGINAGIYTTKFTPKQGFTWLDDTTGSKSVTWKINPQPVQIPDIAVNQFTYNGNEISVTFSNLDENAIIISGNTSATNVGEYSVKFKLKTDLNYKWADGTTEIKKASWKINKAVVSSIPIQHNILAYTGVALHPTWLSDDSSLYTISGTISAIDAGVYSVEFRLADPNNYMWEDGTSNSVKIGYWEIKSSKLHIPTQDGVLTYLGHEQSPTWINYDSEKIILDGTTKGIDAGTYSARFTPKKNYSWEDDTNISVYVNWNIDKAKITKIPSQHNTLTYNGNSQSPEWRDYDSDKLDIMGDLSGINADTYTANFTPTYNYMWEDGTSITKSSLWNISTATVKIPSVLWNLVFTGEFQSPIYNNYDSTIMSANGSTSEINIGTHTTVFSLYDNKNYMWEDGSIDDKAVDWVILPAIIDYIPSQKGTLTYNTKEQSPEWNDYDSTKLSIGGTTSAINNGTYTATFTPTGNYLWSTNDTDTKYVDWVITKDIIEIVPSQKSSIIYNGNEQKPEWNNYDSEKLTIGGNTVATNVGSYTATFTPKDNYMWADGTTRSISITWRIERALIDVIPSQKGTLIYNGNSQSPEWNDYDENLLYIGGITSSVDAGTYIANFTPKGNYMWSDGTNTSKAIKWIIEKVNISIPSQSGTLIYNGNSQSPEWNNYDSTKLTIGGVTSGIDAGTYTATFTPTGNYLWEDGTSDFKNIHWYIDRAIIDVIPSQKGTLTYNTKEQSPEWNDYDSNKLTIGGTTSGINAGTYTATFTPKDSYMWFDGTYDNKSISWVIGKNTIDILPSQKGTLIYNGNSQSPEWNDYDSNNLTISGITSAINNGTYTATFTPKDNYIWSDSTNRPIDIPWYIDRAIIDIYPSQKNTLTYNGNTQSPTWNNYDSEKLTIGGVITGIDAGTYTATFTPKDNYMWIDGTYDLKKIGWVIEKDGLAYPSQKNTLTYNGNTQSPTWNNYDSSKMTIGGTTKGIDAGTYTATFTPTGNYMWIDETVTTKEIKWVIDRAIVTAIPSQKGTLTYNGGSQSPIWNNYDADKLTISGITRSTLSGTYTAKFTPKDNYMWSDGTIDAEDVNWVIGKATINAIPNQSIPLTYNGLEQSPTWNNYYEDYMTIGGVLSGIISAEYTATFTPKDNYMWSDGTSDTINVLWYIDNCIIDTAPSQKNTLFYNGSSQSPTWNNYYEDKMTIGGTTSGIDAGTYTATFTPNKNYMWSDGTKTDKNIEWIIQSINLEIPSQKPSLTYNGNTQSPTWNNYDADKMTIGGTTSGIDAGNYIATFTPKDNYMWNDGTKDVKNIDWYIDKAVISAIPSQKNNLIYNEKTQSPTWNNYDSSKMTIGGTTTGIDVGTYIATFTPTSNYMWADGTSDIKEVEWYIRNAVITNIPSQSIVLVYNGNTQSPTWNNYDSELLLLSGSVVGTSSGTYTATFTPKDNYMWSDGTRTPKDASWTIIHKSLNIPYQKGSIIYTGNIQTPEWNNYNENELLISGDISSTYAGTYTTKFKLVDTYNYKWIDGTTEDKLVTWKINKDTIKNIPSQSGILVYSGSSQYPTWNNYDSSKLTIGGVTTGIDAGTYTATFTPKDNYMWINGTSVSIDVEWIINTSSINNIPSQKNTLTYNGNTQSPTWNNYDSSKLTIGGTTSGIDAGTYTATFTPKDNYMWEDGTKDVKTVTWTISIATITTKPSQKNTLIYNGNTQSPTWNNYDSSKLTMSGVSSAVDAGTYTAKFIPKDNYMWADGSEYINVTWVIKKQSLVFPSQKNTLTYNGSSQSPTWDDYDNTKLTIAGVTSGIDAGTYTATFTIKDNTNYMWYDSTNDSKPINWVIGRSIILELPSQKNTLTYNGSSQSPTWNNYDSSKLTIGGRVSAINAGTYTATFTPKDNYMWADKTITSKDIIWSIDVSEMTLPSQSNTLTYNGNTQSPTWNNYDSSKLTISGTTNGIDAGTYTATFTPNSGYVWSDGTTISKTVNWKINKADGNVVVSYTNLSVTYPNIKTVDITRTTGTSENLSVKLQNNSNIASLSIGTGYFGYTVEVTSNPISAVSYDVIIITAEETKNYKEASTSFNLMVSPGTFTLTGTNYNGSYDGLSHTATFTTSVSGCTLTYSDNESGVYNSTQPSYTDVGSYTIYCKAAKAGYNTQIASATVTITANKLNIPSQKNTLTYNGSKQSPIWNDYDSTKLTIGGVTSGIDAGTYTATFTPTGNYMWSDGTKTSKNAKWIINKQGISTIPSQSGTLTYNGSKQSPIWNNYDSTKLTIGGTTTGIDAGTYTATFTPTSNYMWADGSENINVSWNINHAYISSIPSQKNTLTYNGSSQSPTWDDYDTNKMTIGGTTTGIDAGTYTATFTPTGNYMWSDGTKTSKNVKWIINKASTTISLSTTLVALSNSQSSYEITVSSNSGGNILSYSLDNNIAYGEVDNELNIVTIHKGSASSGTVIININIAETNNYKASDIVQVSVTTSFTPSSIEDATWELISEESSNGTASNYWSVGDCKKIILNGTVGTLALSNLSIYVYILGFGDEGNIYFGTFKNEDGIDIALVDSGYGYIGDPDGTKYFNINHEKAIYIEPVSGSSSYPRKSWVGCDIRYDILGSTDVRTNNYPTSTCATNPVPNTLMAALPSELRAVMKPIESTYAIKGTSTQWTTLKAGDYLPLLSYTRVFGYPGNTNNYAYCTDDYSLSYVPYEYYTNGNSKIKYAHNNPTMAVIWWLNTAYKGTVSYCTAISTTGTVTSQSGYGCSLGLAPYFKV